MRFPKVLSETPFSNIAKTFRKAVFSCSPVPIYTRQAGAYPLKAGAYKAGTNNRNRCVFQKFLPKAYFSILQKVSETTWFPVTCSPRGWGSKVARIRPPHEKKIAWGAHKGRAGIHSCLQVYTGVHGSSAWLGALCSDPDISPTMWFLISVTGPLSVKSMVPSPVAWGR